MIRAIVLLLITLAAPAAHAATLEPVDSPHCLARLSGQIVEGDSQKVLEALPGWKARAEFPRDLAVCLDSPGGSLLEGTRIAALVEENRIGTVIDDGAVCLSACSIIFMLGAVDGGELTTDIGENRVLLEFSRRLHVNGTLGFHRPSFEAPDRSYSRADIQKSFDLAILSSLEFMRMANRWKPAEGAPAMKADLVEALLEHKGQDFFYIDTVDKAGRWDITIFGYDAPRRTSAREALNACDNLSNWHVGGTPPPVRNADTDTLRRLTTRYAQGSLRAGEPVEIFTPIYSLSGRDAFFHADGRMGERYCQIDMDTYDGPDGDRVMTVGACGGDSVLGTSFFEYCGPQDVTPVMEVYDMITIFPSETPLRDLPEMARRIEVEADEIETALMPPAGLSCGAAEDHMIGVVAPEGHVVLHERPDPTSDQVGKAYNYSRLWRGKISGKLFGTEEERATCLDACTGWADAAELPADDRQKLIDTITACFDNDIIWWNADLGNGKEGWASARYLR